MTVYRFGIGLNIGPVDAGCFSRIMRGVSDDYKCL